MANELEIGPYVVESRLSLHRAALWERICRDEGLGTTPDPDLWNRDHHETATVTVTGLDRESLHAGHQRLDLLARYRKLDPRARRNTSRYDQPLVDGPCLLAVGALLLRLSQHRSVLN